MSGFTQSNLSKARFSQSLGTIHFVGIGGIGMSGIAEVMHNLGYTVQGSDIAEGYVIEGLREKGIEVEIGHKAENVEGAAVVVVSTAIKRGNPEVDYALENRIPVVRRAEMLAELMRLKSNVAVAGTHGKTTTTSMVAALLDAGGMDPTVINGGIINVYGTNARLGTSDWMVVEADESDGTFLRLPPTLAIVTNIDAEHLDHYGSFDAIKKAFVDFVEHVPFYGAAFLCIDDSDVQAVLPQVRDRRVVPYGFSAQADIRGDNVRPEPDGNRFDVVLRGRDGETRTMADLFLPMPGRHNVQNALGAIGVALDLGISEEAIKRGLCALWRGEAALHPRGRNRRRDHHRRLRPSSGRNSRRAGGGTRGGARARNRRVPAASLYAGCAIISTSSPQPFNDADIVYVTPVYKAPARMPIPRHRRRRAGREAEGSGAPQAWRRSPMPKRWQRRSSPELKRGRSGDLPGCGRHHEMGGGAGGDDPARAQGDDLGG